MSGPFLRRSFWTDDRSVALGWGLWAILAVAITIAVLRHPDKAGGRSVTGAYREAAQSYLDGRPMYSPGAMGWLYPVQSAMVFIPFTFEPRPASEVLWRLLGIGGLALALRSLTRSAGSTQMNPSAPRHDLFLVTTIFALPPAAGAARNGQMNLHLTALLVLASVCVMNRRWWQAALWLVLAIAAKPVALVLLLLFVALHRPLWWRVPVGLAVVAAMPFLNSNWSYVREQYGAGLHKVVEAGNLHDFSIFRPADMTSLLFAFGVELSESVLTAIRGVAALGTLGLSWLTTRLFDRHTSAVLVLFLGTAYLMFFNPRTEGNTYVMLGAPMAMLAGWSLLEHRWSIRSIVLAFACILMGYAQFLVPHEREYWIRPAETLVLMGLLAAALVVPRLRVLVPRAPMGLD